MPLYHTMGIHSLLAMHLVGGCFVPQPRWDPREALRLIEERADHVALPRPDALPRPRAPPRPRRATTSSSVRALGYAGAAMTSTIVPRCVEVFAPEVFVNHYGSTEIYTFSIGRDQIAQARAAPAARR